MSSSIGKREKRLLYEWKQLQEEPISNITAGPISEDNITIWQATIHGPTDTPYEGGVFHINITFPEGYPFSPMKMQFKTPIYHPNISRYGDICLDTLKDAWTPILNVGKVLLSVCSLLTDPNPSDPLEKSIAKQYIENREKYNRMAKNHTYTHAVEKTYNFLSPSIISKPKENEINEES